MHSLVVIAEAKADFLIATDLADRVLIKNIEWLDESIIDSQRRWVMESSHGQLLTWKSVAYLARKTRIRIHGHFDGIPGLPDAHAARKAISFVLDSFPQVDAIVLIRDADDQLERLHGLEQARQHFQTKHRVIIGLAQPERESWVLSGFLPKDPDEDSRLQQERQTLGFDPCTKSERLTAGKNDSAKLSPKRVLASLTQKDIQREQDCWRLTSLEILKSRGVLNGLKRYLDEVEEHLVSLLK